MVPICTDSLIYAMCYIRLDLSYIVTKMANPHEQDLTVANGSLYDRSVIDRYMPLLLKIVNTIRANLPFFQSEANKLTQYCFFNRYVCEQ